MADKKNISIIKQLIHQVIPYKKDVVFFGSRATGENKNDSDYDFLIIVHNKKIDRKKLIRFQAKIKRLCAKIGLDVDVIVRDKVHADEMKDFPGNIVNSALLTGIYI